MGCSYVHRPADPSAWDDRVLNEVVDGEMAWACPREAADGSEHCVFHRPLGEARPGEVTAAFARELEAARRRERDAGNGGHEANAGRERLTFIGATFPALDLSRESLDAATARALDLRAAEIAGDLDLSDARVGPALRLDRAEIHGRTTLDGATVEGSARFDAATFHGPVSLMGAAFEGDASFADATFAADATLVRTEFRGRANFRSTAFQRANFRHAAFGGAATFGGATFAVPPTFRSATFRETAVFYNADLRGADLFEAGLAETNLRRADLTDADLTHARLNGADMEHARLNRATLASADLRGAGLFGCLLGDVEIDERTRFGRYCVYDPRYDGEHDPVLFEDDERDGPPPTPEGFARKAEATYRLLERVYETSAFPARARRAYRNRRTVRRYRLFRDRAVGRWAVSKLLAATTGYGERPGRVVALSALVILLAGGAYPFLGGVTPVGGSTVYALDPGTLRSVSPADALVVFRHSLYFSAVVFSTLGSGSLEPASATARALAATEALAGTALVAVLVVVLARRTAR